TLGLFAKAHLQHAHLARRVRRPLARLGEFLGVLVLDGRRRIAIELLPADLPGSEVGPGVLDGARRELGPELVAGGVAPLLDRRTRIGGGGRLLAGSPVSVAVGRMLGAAARRQPASAGK